MSRRRKKEFVSVSDLNAGWVWFEISEQPWFAKGVARSLRKVGIRAEVRKIVHNRSKRQKTKRVWEVIVMKSIDSVEASVVFSLFLRGSKSAHRSDAELRTADRRTILRRRARLEQLFKDWPHGEMWKTIDSFSRLENDYKKVDAAIEDILWGPS